MAITIGEFKDLATGISTSIALLTIATGIWLSLREHRLKLRAEARQQRAAEIEAEIRLQTLFVELLKIANGRSGYQVSEKAAEFVLQHLHVEEGKSPTIAQLNQAVEDAAILTLPVGSASQDAAIAAIAALALRYKELEQPGLRALESLAFPVTSQHVAEYRDAVKEELARRSAA